MCLCAAFIKAEMMCVAKIFGVHRALIVSIVKIDVLKRQKMHLEASRLLQITEEEFTKAMECNLNA